MTGLIAFLVIAAVAAFIWLWRAATSAVSDAAGRGVEKAVEARKQRRPSRFWLVPSERTASELRDHLRAHAAQSATGGYEVDVSERRGRQVVQCTVAPGTDPEALRGELLRAARASDPGCSLALP